VWVGGRHEQVAEKWEPLPGSYQPTNEHPTRQQFLCYRDPVAFDLSKLHVGPGTPVGFAVPWTTAGRRSELPGLVVAYAGTKWGPELTVRVGSVRRVADGIYGFLNTMPGSQIATVGLNPNDQYLVETDHSDRNFIVAFGSTRSREGFVASGATVRGRLDSMCHHLRNVHVTLTLPVHNNLGQRFGDVILGDVLGAPTVDTDNDGKPDAWQVSLDGDYLDSMMFSL
jgi:hypothetical protein